MEQPETDEERELREAGPPPAREHVLSRDCWCKPEVEDYPLDEDP